MKTKKFNKSFIVEVTIIDLHETPSNAVKKYYEGKDGLIYDSDEIRYCEGWKTKKGAINYIEKSLNFEKNCEFKEVMEFEGKPYLKMYDSRYVYNYEIVEVFE